MSYPSILGISGKAQHGKDTLAGILTSLYGYAQISFAKGLKDAVYALNPVVRTHTIDYGQYHQTRSVRDLVDEGGWDEAKKNGDVREYLQRMGTEVGREILGADIWVDLAFARAPKGKLLVISDVRFPNEFRAVQDRGGQVWRVNRSGVPPVADHPSEIALDNYVFDQVITNDTSMAGLADRVMGILDGQQITALTRREFFVGALE